MVCNIDLHWNLSASSSYLQDTCFTSKCVYKWCRNVGTCGKQWKIFSIILDLMSNLVCVMFMTFFKIRAFNFFLSVISFWHRLKYQDLDLPFLIFKTYIWGFTFDISKGVGFLEPAKVFLYHFVKVKFEWHYF